MVMSAAYSMNSLPEFTSRQIEILNGSLLGDGCIIKPKIGNCRFVKEQKDANREYLYWHYNELLPYSKKVESISRLKPIIFPQGTILLPGSHKQAAFRTCNHPRLTLLRNIWYPNGIKEVPSDIVLTPLTLAIWFCDDGCNSAKQRNARFCTQGFKIKDCEMLSQKLLELGIETYLCKRNTKLRQRIIQIKCVSYINFIDIIKPFIVWKCFNYKVDTSKYQEPVDHRRKSNLTDKEILDIHSNYRDGARPKDLAKKYNISVNVLGLIVRGKSWKRLWPGGSPPIHTNAKLSDEDKQYAVNEYNKGTTASKIARVLEVHRNTICRFWRSIGLLTKGYEKT